MEDQKTVHATRDQEWAAERVGKPPVHDKHMSSKQALDIHGNGACIRPRHHQPILSQYKSGGLWVRGKRVYGLTVRRRKCLFWCSHSNSFRENVLLG